MKSFSQNILLLILFMVAATLFAQTTPKQTPALSPTAKTSPIPAKKIAVRMVNVTFATDVACKLSIDGKAQKDLDIGVTVKIPLALREHRIEAVSLAASQDRWNGTIDLSSTDTKPIVNVELLPIENKRLQGERLAMEAKKAEEERKAAEAQKKEEEERLIAIARQARTSLEALISPITVAELALACNNPRTPSGSVSSSMSIGSSNGSSNVKMDTVFEGDAFTTSAIVNRQTLTYIGRPKPEGLTSVLAIVLAWDFAEIFHVTGKVRAADILRNNSNWLKVAELRGCRKIDPANDLPFTELILRDSKEIRPLYRFADGAWRSLEKPGEGE